MTHYEILLLASALLLLTLLLNKIAARFGVSSLLVALGVGLFFGNGGRFDFLYDFPKLTLHTGEIALSFIIFAGGFHGQWAQYKKVLREGIALSTVGVLCTTVFVGIFCHYVFDFDWLLALLMGSVISSTDAAAVFSLLENNNIKLKQHTAQVLEFESGTNDPMAYFLALGLSLLATTPSLHPVSLLPDFFITMGLGAAIGIGSGYGLVYLNQKLIFKRGQNTVFFIAAILFIYAITHIAGGSSLLALFIAGVVTGNKGMRNKEFSSNFFEGISWLMETVLFILLGLEVFLNKLPPIFFTGMYITLFLIFFARPVGVHISYLLAPGSSLRKQAFVAWVGLRGATPLVFALIPVVYGVPGAEKLLHITFVVVTLSLILQGFSINFVARKLKMVE